jgi:magnesium-transporting ATPase (P-type)
MDIYAPATAIFPLAFILVVSLFKDGYEDYKRYLNDKETNSKPVEIYRNGNFVKKEAKDVYVSDFILVKGFGI